MQNTERASYEAIMETIFIAYTNSKPETGKFAIETLCGVIRPEPLIAFAIEDYHQAYVWFSILVWTGLHRSADGTLPKILFAETVAFIADTAPPNTQYVIEQAMVEAYPGLSFAGRTEDGKAYYNTSDAAEYLGVSEQELKNEMHELTLEALGEGNTIH